MRRGMEVPEGSQTLKAGAKAEANARLRPSLNMIRMVVYGIW